MEQKYLLIDIDYKGNFYIQPKNPTEYTLIFIHGYG